MSHLLIAHRGDTTNFAENTIEAFESAFQQGADGVELDVQEQTGEIIVVHNYLYDRTGTYPRLSEVLKQCAGKGRLEIEVKPLDLAYMKPLEEVLTPYKDADIELTTSVIGLVSYLRTAFPQFKLGVIFQDREFEPWMTEEDFVTTKVTKLMQLYQADVAHIPPRIISPELVEAIHQIGMKAHVHLPHQPTDTLHEAYRNILSLGIDQSTFDDIDLLKFRASL